MASRPASAGGSRSGVLALFLGGLALRPQHVVIGPLLPLIQADLAISHSVGGLLATIPIICMGLFAVPAPMAAHRFGARAAIGACIAAVAVFGIARALAPGETLVILFTIPVGIAMGLGGALLPVIVRERFADRPASATGMYTNGFQLGAATVSAVAAPVALALGSWRWALVALSAAIGLIALAWTRLVPPRPGEGGGTGPAPRLVSWPVRNPLVWGLAVLFGLRSSVFQGLAAWLPSIYVERGWSEAAAGLLVFTMTVVGIPVTIAGMRMADRHGSRRTYLLGASIGMVASLAGLLLVPALGIVWALAIGVFMGILFPMTMTLPLDIAGSAAAVGPVSSMMFGIGYLIAAVAPVGLGMIRDATQSFTGSIAALVVIAFAMLVLTLAFTPERLAASRGRATA